MNITPSIHTAHAPPTAHVINRLAHLNAVNLKSRMQNRNVIPVLETLHTNLADIKIAKSGGAKGDYLLDIDGQTVHTTGRFESSLLGLIGQGASIFNLFESHEVVERFLEKNPLREDVKITIDRTNNRALGVVGRDKAHVTSQMLMDVLGKAQEDGLSFFYEDGKVLSEHTPGQEFERLPLSFGGETHNMKFFMDCPIDAYGNPALFVGLNREICDNGLVAMTSAFRKLMNLPDPRKTTKIGPEGVLLRQLENFSVGELASTELGKRMDAAVSTPVSVREFRNFTRLVGKAYGNPSGERVRTAMETMAAQVADSLGIASLAVYDDKPSARVPIGYSVYDLINMSTELTTHFDTGSNSSLHGFVGRLLTESYDLQGLGVKAPEPRAFHFLREDEQLALVG